MASQNFDKVLVVLFLLAFPALVVANIPPDVSTTLGPTPLYDQQDASCVVYFEDNDTDVGRIEVNWSVNANEVDVRNFDNVDNASTIESTLDSSNYGAGDQMFCNATAYDKDGDADFGYQMDNILVETDPPNITEGPNFFNYSSEHAFNVSAVIRDREGLDDMSWCRINVTDGEGNQLLDNMTMIKSYGDDAHARCTYSSVNNYTAGFDVLENLSVMVWANDSAGDTGSKIRYNTVPNSAPVIYNVLPKDDSSTAGSDIELEANLMDNDGERVNVSFYNNSGSSPERLHFEEQMISGGSTSEVWNNLQSLKTYQWYVNASDGHQTVIRDLRFRNLISSQVRAQTGFEYRYSTVLASTNNTVTVPFNVKNTANRVKDLQLTVNGVNTVFSSTGSDQKDLNLDPSESENLRIRLNPEDTGMKRVEVLTENENFDLINTDRMDVYVRNPGAAATDVPGLGLIQLLFLVFAGSTLFYSGRL